MDKKEEKGKKTKKVMQKFGNIKNFL